jgi:hypothetical protein
MKKKNVAEERRRKKGIFVHSNSFLMSQHLTSPVNSATCAKIQLRDLF